MLSLAWCSLQVMQKLRLVPLGSEAVEERVAAFRQYNDEVRNDENTFLFPQNS